MRTDLRNRLLGAFVAAVACLALGAVAPPARAQDDGHDHGSRVDVNLSDLTPEQRKAALEAWNHVVCNCEREDWSKTLSNCPDGCSQPQKQEILQRVVQGWSLDAIVEEQVKEYGPKAAADPGTARNGTFLVLAGLVIGGAAAGLVLARWKAAAANRRSAAEESRRTQPVESAESDAVERELREIE